MELNHLINDVHTLTQTKKVEHAVIIEKKKRAIHGTFFIAFHVKDSMVWSDKSSEKQVSRQGQK